jgi:hypothetical protein
MGYFIYPSFLVAGRTKPFITVRQKLFSIKLLSETIFKNFWGLTYISFVFEWWSIFLKFYIYKII